MAEKLYKDADGFVHSIEEGFEHLLPLGCVEISEAEAAQLVAATAGVGRPLPGRV